ncbi:hypothetical protein A9Q76_04810 [Arcobacter sp. 31_11_sub10_T18]|nr:hypothetical protein A9Q76_04810 [Arcobacter sp. 31_11_sub10_T18]
MTIDVNLSQTINNLITSRFTDEVSDSIQRLTSGLKINDSADDIAGLISSNTLKKSSSSLFQGIESGNSGLALVQLSSNSLTNQVNLLTSIQERLTLAKNGSTSDTSRDAIRVDIIDLITQLNDIASDTSYGGNYTLQESNSSTNTSNSISLFYDENSGSTIFSPSLQSNSTGLSLSTLENLTSGNLTETLAISQTAVISTAITSVNTYSDSLELSKTQIGISIENLTNIEKTTNEARENILNTDKSEENAILDKYKLLEQSSKFAIAQANITQATALRLLTDLNNPGNEVKDKNDDIYKPKDNDNTYEKFDNTSNYENFYTSSYNTNTFKPKDNTSSFSSSLDIGA